MADKHHPSFLWQGKGLTNWLKLIVVFSVFGLAIINHPVFAQDKVPGFDTGIKAIEDKGEDLGLVDAGKGDKAKGLSGILLDIINTVLYFGAILALGALVWAGVMYILALGEDSKVTRAKHIILYSIIGLLVMGISYAIIATIRGIFS